MAPVVIYEYFDNRPRCDCCTQHMWDADYKGCPQPKDYLAHGTVEWLRFVWAMNRNIKQYAPADFDWDTDDPFSVLGGFGSPIALLGSKEHPADVVDSLTGETWEGVEVYENFKIYINNKTGRALIECYKPEFEDLFDSATQMVANEYVGEPFPHVCPSF